MLTVSADHCSPFRPTFTLKPGGSVNQTRRVCRACAARPAASVSEQVQLSYPFELEPEAKCGDSFNCRTLAERVQAVGYTGTVVLVGMFLASGGIDESASAYMMRLPSPLLSAGGVEHRSDPFRFNIWTGGHDCTKSPGIASIGVGVAVRAAPLLRVIVERRDPELPQHKSCRWCHHANRSSGGNGDGNASYGAADEIEVLPDSLLNSTKRP